MRKLYKNNYGIASPIEFSIASMALISTLIVVTASMAPPVEQASAQFYADANAKATEIMSLLLTSESQAGLVIDPKTSVPTPPTGSISDITIHNSPPSAQNPNPGNGDDVRLRSPPNNNVNLSVVALDPDPDDVLNVSFYNASNDEHIGTDHGVSRGDTANFTWSGLSRGVRYNWYVKVDDSEYNVTQGPWFFTTIINRPPNPPEPINGGKPFTGYAWVNYSFKTSTRDPDGDDIFYWWDWGDRSNSGWVGPYASGVECIESHIWGNPPRDPYDYYVQVRAKDDPEGALSEWSESLRVTIKANNPPYISPAGDPPSGPTDAIAGVTKCEYSTVAEDPDADEVRVGWDWDNDFVVDEWTIYQNYNPYRTTHVWSKPGVYWVRAIPQDNHSALGSWSNPLTVIVKGDPPPSDPPAIPTLPTGPELLRVDEPGDYQTSTIDPDRDRVKYGWDWYGDSVVDEWDDNRGIYYASGEEISTSHSWSSAGTYYVKVKAEDEHGIQSDDWSKPLIVTVKAGNGPRSCFLAGTQILMADGTQKNIEAIQVGDIVKSYDVNSDSIQNDRVTEIYHDTPAQMISDYYLIVNNHLKVTPDHLLYINNEWIQAGDLKLGDHLFKGKVTSLEKIYEKVPSYNLEIEKYHTYLVVFGDNIVIAHNVGRRYILTGNEEEISLSRQTSVTENDYTALLSMDKIFELAEIPYQELKEILGLPDGYYFYITIGNSESIFLNYMPDQSISLDSANAVVTCSENVIIVDSVGYAYATIAVTVVR